MSICFSNIRRNNQLLTLRTFDSATLCSGLFKGKTQSQFSTKDLHPTPISAIWFAPYSQLFHLGLYIYPSASSRLLMVVSRSLPSSHSWFSPWPLLLLSYLKSPYIPDLHSFPFVSCPTRSLRSRKRHSLTRFGTSKNWYREKDKFLYESVTCDLIN